MSFKPFEIWSYQPAGWPEAHPCVIISHAARADRRTPIEILICTSARANRPPEESEFVLDQADGLDWPTLCKCELILAVPRSDIKQRRGIVSVARQSALLRKVIAAHNWSEILAHH